jgi:glycosyltransferase involved in cell wall biosynthesis
MLKNNVTAVMFIYNEESRILRSLRSIVNLFDNILIFNKSSTDDTRNICLSFSPKIQVIDIPYSQRGDDDFESLKHHIKTKWVFALTASETVPEKLITVLSKYFVNGKEEDVDLFMIPRKYFMLSSHVPNSPWSILYFPFFFNMERVTTRNKLHDHVLISSETRVKYIEPEESICVVHRSNETVKSFIESSIEYSNLYARQSGAKNFEKNLKSALRQNLIYQNSLLIGRSIGSIKHYAAWNVYWGITILQLIENSEPNLSSDKFEYYPRIFKFVSYLVYLKRRAQFFLNRFRR